MDLLLMVRFGLESLGHQVAIERNMAPGKANIIIECFTYDFLEIYREFSEVPGTDYILIASECMTNGTFNQFGEAKPGPIDRKPDSHYDDAYYWKKRHKTFLEALKRARCVWHLSDIEADIYRKSLGIDNVYYLPHGYAPEFQRVVHKRPEHKDIDVLFTGTPTPYRQKKFAEIAEKGLQVRHVPPLGHPQREDLVARAKLAVNIRQDENWVYPSNSRFHYHLNNASLLVTERCTASCDLSKFVVESAPEDIAEVCAEFVRKGNYQEEAQARLERFRAERPMGPLLEALLDESYSR
jgi:hypothetical protein